MAGQLYAELAAYSAAWRSPDVAAAFDGHPFEEAMRDFLEREALAELTKHGRGPKYFLVDFTQPPPRSVTLQWALAEFFYRYRLRPDSLYERLARAGAGRLTAHTLRLATLNYDTLLSQALRAVGLEPNLGQRGATGTQPRICLPHGSAELRCAASIGEGGPLGSGEFIPAAGSTFITGGHVALYASIEQLRAEQGSFTQPMPAFFIPEKTNNSCANAIEAHRRMWAEWAGRARRVVIIGAQVREADVHIWAPLAARARTASEPEFLYVSGSSGPDFDGWRSRCGFTDATPSKNWRWQDAESTIQAFLDLAT